MGTVWRVWDRELHREVAMKVIRPRGLAGSSTGSATPLDDLALFLEEVQITGQLDHPCIVPVLDIGRSEDGDLFYLMPLLRGRDLKHVIDELHAGSLEWTLPRVVDALCKAAQAVAYAHQRGVVHRDLKPANVMVGALGETWVLDWGLATLAREPVPAGAGLESVSIDADAAAAPLVDRLVGTPGYMAPEQAEPQLARTGPSADVYALGAILYQILTGQMPYQEPPASCAADSIAQRMLQGPPQRVLSIAPQASPDLAAVCERAMRREPAQRYASAAALADDLRAWLEGRAVSALDVGMFGALRKWRRRNPAAAHALDALGVVLVLGTLVLAIQEHQKVLAVTLAHREETRANYASNMHAVEFSLGARDAKEARRLLAVSPASMRAWEWSYLGRASDVALRVLGRQGGHGCAVQSLSVSADGRWAASGGVDGRVLLWDLDSDAETPARELAPPVPKDKSACRAIVAFAPHGQRLALSLPDGVISVRDVQSGAELARCVGLGAGVRSIDWRSDGAQIAAGDEHGDLALWNAADGAPLPAPHLPHGGEKPTTEVAFSPDGQLLLAVFEHGPPVLWSLARAEPDPRFDERAPEGSFSAHWHPDGKRAAFAGRGAVVRALSLDAPGAVVEYESQLREAHEAVWSSDGKWLATGALDASVCVWRDGEKEPEQVLLGHTGCVNALCWLPKDERLLSASSDGTLRLWSRQARDPQRWVAGGAVLALGYDAAAGTLSAAGNDGRWLRRKLGTGESTTRAIPVASFAAFDASARHLALALAEPAGQVALLSADESEPAQECATGLELITALCSSRAGERCAFGALDGSVRVLAKDGREEAAWSTLAGKRVQAMVFRPGTAELAVASQKDGIELWRVGRAQRVRTIANPGAGVSCMEFAPDGARIAIADLEGRIAIVPLGTGAATVLGGHEKRVLGLRWSEYDGRLASISIDRTLRLWDPRCPTPLATLGPLSRQLGSLVYAPREGWVAAGAYGRGMEGGNPIAIWWAEPVQADEVLAAEAGRAR